MFEGEDDKKPTVTEKKIEEDFVRGLHEAAADPSKTPANLPSPGEPNAPRTGFIDKWFIEQFCDFKNSIISSRLSANLTKDGKALVTEFYAATPEEVEAYLNLTEYGCVHLMPAEWLDAMEAFFKHPASAVLRLEVMKYRSLLKKLDAFKVEEK